MDYLVVGLVAAFASLLTFFSGFGLGTILTPAFILFFPVEVAVSLTAIVHFLNNLFKISLVGKSIETSTLVRFGLPAIAGAFGGAYLLFYLAGDQALASYTIGSKEFFITPVNIALGLLMIFFSLFEIIPKFKSLRFGKKMLIPGGILSGFFGGLSGHQGALRSAFLIRLDLTKQQFIATGVAIACLVDMIRLTVYSSRISADHILDNVALLSVAVISAFSGAYLGKKWLEKVTLGFVQNAVAILMMILGLGLMFGLFAKS